MLVPSLQILICRSLCSMQVAFKRQRHHHPLAFFRLSMLNVLSCLFRNGTSQWWCDHFMVIFNYRFITSRPIKEEAETPSDCATTHHEAFKFPTSRFLIDMEGIPYRTRLDVWEPFKLQSYFSGSAIRQSNRIIALLSVASEPEKGQSFTILIDNLRCI